MKFKSYIIKFALIFGLSVSLPLTFVYSSSENEQINNTRLNIEDLKKLNNIDKIMDAIEKINIANEILEINIEDELNCILIIQNKKIYIGDSNNLTNKVLYLKSILEKEKDSSGIIFINGDINSGFKPYFREE